MLCNRGLQKIKQLLGTSGFFSMGTFQPTVPLAQPVKPSWRLILCVLTPYLSDTFLWWCRETLTWPRRVVLGNWKLFLASEEWISIQHLRFLIQRHPPTPTAVTTVVTILLRNSSKPRLIFKTYQQVTRLYFLGCNHFLQGPTRTLWLTLENNI